MVAKKTTAKAVKKYKTTKKAAKPQVIKFKTDAEYMNYLAELEADRTRRILAGENVPMIENIDFDTSNLQKGETKVNKMLTKAFKTKSPKRPETRKVKRKCPGCSRDVEVSAEDAALYEFDPNSTNSQKSLFNCGKCQR